LKRANFTLADGFEEDRQASVGVDFSDANLAEAKLSRADFRCAVLQRAQLPTTDLSYAALEKADLRDACLDGANLHGARLSGANLDGASLKGAKLTECSLLGASLQNTDLTDVDLSGSNLTGANLNGATLLRTNLRGAMLLETTFRQASLVNCKVYGVSAWQLSVEGTQQEDLLITDDNEPEVTVDDLEVAQFIHLMMNNGRIRAVIDSITSKGVLILGRFSDPARKAVLDGLRTKLREFDLLPMVFDFDRPTDKDYTETVQTLAGLSKFVIVDVTNPKSTPLELEATVKQFKIPYVPIIDISVDPKPFAMLVDLQKSFHWVLKTTGYQSKEQLLDDGNLKKFIIDRAMAKREELRANKNQEPETLSMGGVPTADDGA
jgi:uncharacterized protein YjbI with pentapeptide repeats